MQKIIFKVLIMSLFFSCSTIKKIEALKPEPNDAAPLVYETTTSFINLPIKINLKDIENQTNKYLSGLIYEDNTIEDDDCEIKIWKLAPIVLESDNGKIKTILPLKAYVKYRIGTNKLGISLYNTKEFYFNGKVTLTSDVGLKNWKINTNTELKSLDWNESPTVIVLGKAIPITYLINPAVRIFKSKIEKSIDEAITNSMDFKPNVLDALEVVCTPFEMSKKYSSWLSITPIDLYTTEAKLQKEFISFEMGLKCTLETFIGKKPNSKFDRNKIILKPVLKMPGRVSVNIVAVSKYEDASSIMTKNFEGQVFQSGKKKVTVQNVAIWHKEGKMIIALDLLGSINGKIYLTGFPQYNDDTKEIYFDKLEYVLETKSSLLRTANWFAEGYILKKIQQTCRYSIQPNLEEGKQNMMQYLKNFAPLPGVFVNGKIEDIQFQKIQLTNQAIIAFVKVIGDVHITVDGIK